MLSFRDLSLVVLHEQICVRIVNIAAFSGSMMTLFTDPLFINNISRESTTLLHLMALSDSTVAFVQLQNLRCDASDVSSQTFSFAEAQNANFNTMPRVCCAESHKTESESYFLGNRYNYCIMIAAG